MVWALREKGRADTEAANALLAAQAEQQARTGAEANERKAIAGAERAERELARANEIKRLITEMLQSVSPEEAQGADIALLKGILDDASERLKSGEITDGLIAAELHAVVGGVYWRLGLYPQAEAHTPVAMEISKRVLGDEHPDTLGTITNLGNFYSSMEQYADAAAMFETSLPLKRPVLARDAAPVDGLRGARLRHSVRPPRPP